MILSQRLYQWADSTAPRMRLLRLMGAGADDLYKPLTPQLVVRRTKNQRPIRRQVKNLTRLAAVVVAAYAMPVKNRLNLANIVKKPLLAVPVVKPARRPPKRKRSSTRLLRCRGPSRRRRRTPVVMTTNAPSRLTRLDKRPAPHRLDHHPIFIQKLKIYKPLARNCKISRPVRFNRNGPQYSLIIKIMPVHRRRHRTLTLPVGVRPVTLLGRLNYAKKPDIAAINPLHMRTAVNVRNVEITVGIIKIAAGRYRRRGTSRPKRHRIVTTRPLCMDKNLIAENVN